MRKVRDIPAVVRMESMAVGPSMGKVFLGVVGFFFPLFSGLSLKLCGNISSSHSSQAPNRRVSCVNTWLFPPSEPINWFITWLFMYRCQENWSLIQTCSTEIGLWTNPYFWGGWSITAIKITKYIKLKLLKIDVQHLRYRPVILVILSFPISHTKKKWIQGAVSRFFKSLVWITKVHPGTSNNLSMNSIHTTIAKLVERIKTNETPVLLFKAVELLDDLHAHVVGGWYDCPFAVRANEDFG